MTLSLTKREPRAEEFEYDLIADIYSNYEMHPLWLKYQHLVKLPVHDYENVEFEGNDNNSEYKKLKDFIEDFEQKLYSHEKSLHY